ncbi:MAG TPA: PASTA domain-containing protein [Terracidiphilus sp.]|nr:PASTA domain-containing protein [Terracidiphilus sp.]
MKPHFLLGFFRTASLLMLLVVLALLSAIATMHFAIHGAEVQVPSLNGMTVTEARSEAAGMGLNLDVDNRYYSAEVPAGHILTQSPASGTIVRREWRVRVSESLGPQKVDVPSIVGADERLAALELRRAGLEVGASAHLPDVDAAEGVVIAQDPPPHAQGIEQPSVNVLLAAPPRQGPDGYVMPDFTGMPIVAAQALLANVGLQSAVPSFADVSVQPVGSGSEPPRLPIPPGAVLAQDPAPGARVDQTMQVKFTVAK